jgi:hypothetical protein
VYTSLAWWTPTEFRSKNKFRGIDSERFPLFRGRKHSFRGIPLPWKSRFRSSERNWTEWNSAEKISFTKRQQNNLTKWCWFLFHGMVRNGIPRVYFYFLLHGKEFRVVFSSAESFEGEFRKFASILVLVWNRIVWFVSIFVPRNGIPSYFLFCGRVRNGIPRFSVPRNNRNSVRNNHLFRPFHLPRNYFFSEIPNPIHNSRLRLNQTLVSYTLAHLAWLTSWAKLL